MISINFSALLYLLASVLFILSLKGLSSPTSARKGNYFGIIGMAIAIITTILQPDTSNYFLIITAIIIGGVIGTSIALKIEMTAMPQLVVWSCNGRKQSPKQLLRAASSALPEGASEPQVESVRSSGGSLSIPELTRYHAVVG